MTEKARALLQDELPHPIVEQMRTAGFTNVGGKESITTFTDMLTGTRSTLKNLIGFCQSFPNDNTDTSRKAQELSESLLASLSNLGTLLNALVHIKDDKPSDGLDIMETKFIAGMGVPNKIAAIIGCPTTNMCQRLNTLAKEVEALLKTPQAAQAIEAFHQKAAPSEADTKALLDGALRLDASQAEEMGLPAKAVDPDDPRYHEVIAQSLIDDSRNQINRSPTILAAAADIITQLAPNISAVCQEAMPKQGIGRL